MLGYTMRIDVGSIDAAYVVEPVAALVVSDARMLARNHLVVEDAHVVRPRSSDRGSFCGDDLKLALARAGFEVDVYRCIAKIAVNAFPKRKGTRLANSLHERVEIRAKFVVSKRLPKMLGVGKPT
eukprot:CAMPEP_0117014156 /NCGR_PEP_ID=MMETSP0472-20121206/11539_1 /TAXON_ID=693140 ORGANISM="Tiarina fusus, Strain LIS" /NCGR_SAMPLE_ID=MMETSP0472 /ASSEMBLY_ACC=CAM_ASM_000603 /LENGTH=124 /DNA_ID=CAMNT_0004717649 /DNA_START=219 /DNA_END=593 /DNA_ORIENTATION=+